MTSITCRRIDEHFTEPHTHYSVDAVRRHYAADVDTYPCNWQVQDNGWTLPWYDSDTGECVSEPEYIEALVDCGALAWITPVGGFECENGHEHTPCEVREAEGWDYAGDAYDAACLTAGGRSYRPAGPGTSIDPREVSKVRYELNI